MGRTIFVPFWIWSGRDWTIIRSTGQHGDSTEEIEGCEELWWLPDIPMRHILGVQRVMGKAITLPSSEIAHVVHRIGIIIGCANFLTVVTGLAVQALSHALTRLKYYLGLDWAHFIPKCTF